MAKELATNCTCGAAYDEKGVCTGCGKQRPRSGGYHTLHNVLCILGTLFLLCCLTRSLMMNDWLKDYSVPQGMRESRISDAQIPFVGSVAHIICKSHTDDPNIRESDIAEAIDAIGIPQILAGKIEQHFAMLRGDSDEPMTLTADEIITPLEQNRQALHQKCHLIIEDSDLDEIREAVDGGGFRWLIFGFGYGNGFFRAIGRFFVSIWGILFELALFGLLLWRWMVIKRNSGRPKTQALRNMGLTLMIPMLALLFVLLVILFSYIFISGEYVGLKPFLRTVRPAIWLNPALIASTGLFMIMLTRYLVMRAKVKEKNAAQEAAPAAGIDAGSAPAPAVNAAAPVSAEPAAVPAAPVSAPAADTPVSAPAPAPAPAAASGDAVCISCGQPLSGKKKFCIYCGTNQETGKNAIDEMLEMPDPKDPDENA